MAGSAPVVTANTATSDTVAPGGSADWTVQAQDATARTFVVSRNLTDTQGNTVTVTKTFTISDALTYGAVTVSDPAVTAVVDPVDPRIVHLSVSVDA